MFTQELHQAEAVPPTAPLDTMMAVHDKAVRVGIHADRDSAMERAYARMVTLATGLPRNTFSDVLFNKFLPAWSPETHKLFSDVARAYASFLLLVGAHLEQTVEGKSFMDVWLYHIMPLLMKPLRITEGRASKPTFGDFPSFGAKHDLFANVRTYAEIWNGLHDAAAIIADDRYGGPCRFLVIDSLGSLDWRLESDRQTPDGDEISRRLGWVMQLIKKLAETFNVAVMILNRTKTMHGRQVLVNEGQGTRIIMHLSATFMPPGEVVSDSPAVRKALELAKSYTTAAPVQGWQGVVY